MKWERIGNYAMRSDCGKYTVCKLFVQDVPQYSAWRGRTQLAWRLASADEAKAVCEQDAKK